uniref:Uncharacterized protein n=1 Tax=Anguilla anguilla TaxID=7936 RepID=A0A0E9SE22_ANGAN
MCPSEAHCSKWTERSKNLQRALSKSLVCTSYSVSLGHCD